MNLEMFLASTAAESGQPAASSASEQDKPARTPGYLANAKLRRALEQYAVDRATAYADFRTGISAPGSGEFEVELASAPPGDGGVGGQVGFAEDG